MQKSVDRATVKRIGSLLEGKTVRMAADSGSFSVALLFVWSKISYLAVAEASDIFQL